MSHLYDACESYTFINGGLDRAGIKIDVIDVDVDRRF